MNSATWQKLMTLMKRTKGQCFLIEAEGDEVFVLMTAEKYEELLANHQSAQDLTEEELLDRINRDLSVWQTRQEAVAPLRNEEGDNEEDYYLEPVDNEQNE